MAGGRSVVVWFGNKWEMDKGETMNHFIKRIKDGEMMFDAPDYIKITSAKQRSLTKVRRYI